MSRFLVSMSGPGIRPWIRNAPSRIAMEADPGTPKAMVGTRAPPSLALFDDFRSDHAAHVAGAEGFRRPLLGARRVAVGDPVDHRGAEARRGPDGGTDPGAAQHQPPVVKGVAHPLPSARRWRRSCLRSLGDGGPNDRHIGELGQGEQSDRQRHDRQTVPQVERIERPAQRAGLRVRPDHGDQQAETGRADTAHRRAARQHRHHRQAENCK